MATKLGMYSATHKSVTVPASRDKAKLSVASFPLKLTFPL